MDSETILSTFEIYPADEPIGYRVGFTTSCNGRSFYRQTVVSLEDVWDKKEDEIIDIALSELKQEIQSEIEILSKKSKLIGKSITL